MYLPPLNTVPPVFIARHHAMHADAERGIVLSIPSVCLSNDDTVSK